MQSAAPARLAIVSAVALLLVEGKLRIFTADAAKADEPSAGQQLAEVPFAPFSPATDDGVAASVVASPLGVDLEADESGRAAHWRAYSKDGAPLLKGTVSLEGGGGELQLKKVDIVKGGAVQITSFVLKAA